MFQENYQIQGLKPKVGMCILHGNNKKLIQETDQDFAMKKL